MTEEEVLAILMRNWVAAHPDDTPAELMIIRKVYNSAIDDILDAGMIITMIGYDT